MKPSRKGGAARNDNSTSSPLDDPNNILVGWKEGVTLLDVAHLDAVMQMPLPGIVIFVHGVNSDGEWYAPSEQGLCTGLNERLKRRSEHMAYASPEGGQLTPPTYTRELTDDGFLDPERTHKTFIRSDDHFSPVIQFRWGYKASAQELQEYGDSIYLNEHNYWGGGPFANGCTALPDMWCDGLSDSLFLWLQVQHMNPVPERQVYSCPPRAYYVLAALRLARLIESIRKKQADVPITVVCHSQGNMIGIAAAFLGDRLAPVTDAAGVQGRCVADSYVLANAPYSLLKSNFIESWNQGGMTDPQGGTGRQSVDARIKTLRAFFDIIRKPASMHQTVEQIDRFMANKKNGFDAASDRARYGYGVKAATCCRVTLYCNPHDQVISSTTVQGIGWRGMSGEEIHATGGVGIFSQRVFAQGYMVGEPGNYHFWKNHHKNPEPGSADYWFPESPKAKYSVSQGLDAQRNAVGKVVTVLSAPFMIVALKVAGVRINALPDKDWVIPLQAPALPDPFVPKSLRYKTISEKFDEEYDVPGEARDTQRARDDKDPYKGDRKILRGGAEGERETTDAAKGDAQSEAALRYEDHARLRMEARRKGLADKAKETAPEDKQAKANAYQMAWRNERIKNNLVDCINAHATDHSTIMTNGMHAQMALAYDVAVGVCHISAEDLHRLRIAADWRLLDGLGQGDPNKIFEEYFLSGTFNNVAAREWVRATDSAGKIPAKIVDQRENRPRNGRSNGEE